MTHTQLYIRLAIIAAVLLLASPFSSIFAQPNPKLFAYDRARPLDLKEVSSKDEGAVNIRDIEYAAYNPARKRVKAYVVSPKTGGRFAGVLFFHWLGHAKSDRTEFLDEAIAMARQGTVSLLIQGNFPWLEAPSEGQADRKQIIDQTIEVRRALDLLLSQPQVDRRRIGFVGHDYGAMFGSLASGFEKRVRTYVFMAAHPNFSEWSLGYWKATAKAGADVYRNAIRDLEPILYVGRAKPASLLFQFANTDKYISRERALEFFAAASNPKQIKWYDTEHALEIESARQDRRNWLVQQLKLRVEH